MDYMILGLVVFLVRKTLAVSVCPLLGRSCENRLGVPVKVIHLAATPAAHLLAQQRDTAIVEEAQMHTATTT